MNIVFLLKSLKIGGVEIVTITLANKFVKEGHNVSIFCASPSIECVERHIDSRVKIYNGIGYRVSQENIRILRDLFVTNKISLVINQWGLPYVLMKIARKAGKDLNLKYVSFHHNDPSTNGKLKPIEIALKTTTGFKYIILFFKYYLYKIITSASMRYVYNKSDCYMVLSKSYLSHLCDFLSIKRSMSKQNVLPNPITIDVCERDIEMVKEKMILYCGRLDNEQKKVFRVLEIWKLIFPSKNEWKLVIIGDGPARKDMEKYAKENALKNVFFLGFKSPIEYYKKAALLLLTSDYEGFPLVLPECMSLGVVPVVYASFSAVYDIIDDNKDGIIISYNENGYDARKTADRILELMSDKKRMQELSQNAIEKSKYYTVDNVYKEWERLVFQNVR